jgi:hypothetical protein
MSLPQSNPDLYQYVRVVSPFSPATDMRKILDISDKYGITFHM